MYDSRELRKEILAFLETANLVDIWRMINPQKKTFTWKQSETLSREDYFLISDHLKNTFNNINIKGSLFSDHCNPELNLTGYKNVKQGRGFWNISSLTDLDYINLIIKIIQNCYAKKEIENKHPI